MTPTTLIEKIEQLSLQYARCRIEFENHPLFPHLSQYTREELPADLRSLVEQYELARQNLGQEKIEVPSLVILKEPVQPEPTISTAPPITLSNIVRNDARGEPARTYKTVTASGEAIKDTTGYHEKKQGQWTAYFSGKKEKLISLPLLYAVLERLVDEKHPGLTGLAQDFNESYLCTSTRINYAENTITHNYGAADAETFSCTIPVGDGYLETFQKNKAFQSSLRALLMARDLDKAEETLLKASYGKPYFWTPNASNRTVFSQMAVFIGAYVGGRLLLSCNSNLNYNGRARSVALE